jgi:multidrug efflux pump subunit AcrA (membrane-fusion protein)
MCGGGLYATYHYGGTTEVEVATARVRRGDFVISVRARGDIRSARSIILRAPQVPGLSITHLAINGSTVKKGEVVVEFDPVQQEQNIIARTTAVRSADGDIEQTKATQVMDNDADDLNKMTSEYQVESSKLDASKAAVLSAVDGAKFRLTVGVNEGSLQQVKSTVNAHQIGHESDLSRLNQRKNKAVADLSLAQSYLPKMQLRAPVEGPVNLLANFRAGGTFGQTPPPFKEGDNAWTGAAIAEIPDLSEMYVDLALEEVDRGKLELGQSVRVRVDAIPDKEFQATIDYISPIAVLVFKGGMSSNTAVKTFPARATLKSVDPRLRPGMSSTAEIIIERQPGVLLMPIRASFDRNGKPAVYVQIGKNFATRGISVGKQNDEDIVVTGGLKEDEIVTLESPAEAAKRAKKKL